MRVSESAQRRFVLGLQGLWPGRRWKGPDGARDALLACRRVRVDPLDVIGRVQDLIFASRVEGYRRDHLDLLLYRERAGFEFGGAVSVYPRDLLRLHWSWVQNEGLPKRWEAWYSKNKKLTLQILQEIKKRGPLGSQDWPDGERVEDYRSSHAEGLALYFLWRHLDILVHHREGNRKFYDLIGKMFGPLREPLSAESTLEEMACETLGWLGLSGAEGVPYVRTTEEGRGRSKLTKQQLRQRLVNDGRLVEVQVEGEKLANVVRAEQVPLLEEVSQGGIPVPWRPLESEPETKFLAPLDVVIANGRSQALFGFEYLWEVYKPARKRRWGYYVLPVLLGDQLVGRIEPVLARDTKRLLIQRAWWEEGTDLHAVAKPFARGIMRFADFLQAKDVAFGDVGPSAFQASLEREAVRARN
ncbi:MAG: winged helix DNA-binding domain-containing protein [Nitrososphaerota archaeon]|nr:winged helix DNA-binding domain-containing protein [Nitrososphaerota archaeon]MDG6974891.1 winged helix DNA-binding domain-containing protein [Nitrososphaerota archaeon]